jgi:hypothetical protein
MLSHIHSKRLPAKAKTAKLFLSALIFNNLINSYTLTDLTKQVIRGDVYL